MTDGVRQKFTSKERDTEPGLDFFAARYYSSTQGRFTSPDEFTGGPDELYDFAEDASNNPTFYAELENPQSLNKYQYTYNNPLRYTDPTGHCVGVLRVLCTPAGQRAIERVGQRVIERATPYVATVVGAVAGAVARMGEGAPGDPSCPSCDGMSNTLEFQRRENEAAARSQDNSGNQDGSSQRGSGNPATAEAAAEGRAQHKDFAEKVKAKPGWKSEPTVKDPKTGKSVRPDAVTPSGRPVELKPNTPTGRAQGRRQLPGQERATGKRGRVVYYEPKRKKADPQ